MQIKIIISAWVWFLSSNEIELQLKTAIIFVRMIKKIKVCCLLLCMISISIYASDRSKMNLKGKVKSITTFEYDAHSKGDSVIKDSRKFVSVDDYNYTQFDSLGKIIGQQSILKENTTSRYKLFKYDSKDSVIEVTVLNTDSEFVDRVQFLRDEKHRATEIRFINSIGAAAKSYTQQYGHDSASGRLTMEWIERDATNQLNKYVATPKEISFYDKNGNLTEIHHYTFSNPTTMILGNKSKFSYTKSNKLKEAIDYFKNDSVQKKITYNYSPEGKLKSTAEVEYLYSRALKKKVESAFNEKGDPEKKTILIPEENKTEKWTYKYEYDLKGNWIKQTAFLNGSAVKIVERTLEYFAEDNMEK